MWRFQIQSRTPPSSEFKMDEYESECRQIIDGTEDENLSVVYEIRNVGNEVILEDEEGGSAKLEDERTP